MKVNRSKIKLFISTSAPTGLVFPIFHNSIKGNLLQKAAWNHPWLLSFICPECQQNPVGPTLEINPQTDHFSSPLFLPPSYVIISQIDYYNNVNVASPFQPLSPNSPFSSRTSRIFLFSSSHNMSYFCPNSFNDFPSKSKSLNLTRPARSYQMIPTVPL